MPCVVTKTKEKPSPYKRWTSLWEKSASTWLSASFCSRDVSSLSYPELGCRIPSHSLSYSGCKPRALRRGHETLSYLSVVSLFLTLLYHISPPAILIFCPATDLLQGLEMWLGRAATLLVFSLIVLVVSDIWQPLYKCLIWPSIERNLKGQRRLCSVVLEVVFQAYTLSWAFKSTSMEMCHLYL